MIENSDTLETLLNEPPAPETAGGLAVTVKALQIQQLPQASRLAAVLFGENGANFGGDEFFTTLTETHVDAMAELLALACYQDQAVLLGLPIAEFLRLFNVFIERNSDFFFAAMRTALKKKMASAAETGEAFSSGSETPDTQSPSATP